MFAHDLAGRVLGFDTHSARAFSEIAVRRRALGRAISHADAQIAAIAYVHKAKLATRNIGDFQDCGVEVLDPWAGS
jgi:predicted nucleic acid-binding protein